MLTESLYNSYYKLAVVDDSMLSRYFDEYEIDDYATRSKLTALMHSRPVTYDRQEMHPYAGTHRQGPGSHAGHLGQQYAQKIITYPDGYVHCQDLY